jgi:preprotein translocase subunit SecG
MIIEYTLYTLFVIACIILILVVLLQPGRGDAASAFGGGMSGAAFGPRGTTTLLAKITIGAAVAFMGIAFLFSVPGLVTSRSVTSGLEATPPVAPADQPPAEPQEMPVELPPASEPATSASEPAPGETVKEPAETEAVEAPAESQKGEGAKQ